MPTYPIKDIPDDLWSRVKARAESEGRGQGLRWVLVQLLEYYADNGLPKVKVKA
jgi:hypothetical protein